MKFKKEKITAAHIKFGDLIDVGGITFVVAHTSYEEDSNEIVIYANIKPIRQTGNQLTIILPRHKAIEVWMPK